MHKAKKRPLLQSLILSYLLVLFPLALLCYVLFQNHSAVLEGNLQQMQYAQLHRYQTALQSELTDLTLLANQFYTTVSQTNAVTRSRADLQSTDHTTMVRLRTQLSSAVNTSRSVEEILLYMGKSGYGITSKRVLPLDQLYSLTENHEALWKSLDELKQLLSFTRRGGLQRVDDTLYFFTGLGNGSCVLFNLRPDYLIDLYGENSTDEYFAFTTLQGDILFQNGEDFPLDTVQFLAEEGEFASNKWLVTALRLDGYDYRIISVRSRTAIRTALLKQTTGLLAAIPVCTFLSFMVIILSLKRNYTPVAEVLRMANDSGFDTDEENHEFDQLHTLLQKALDDRQKLKQREDRIRLRQDDARLYTELGTSQAETAAAKRFAQCRQPFPMPYWCYIEMTLVDYGDVQDDETIFSIAQELIRKMLEPNFSVVSLQTGQQLLFLMGLQHSGDSQIPLFRNDLQRALSFLQEEYSAEFVCCATDVAAVGESFSQTSITLMEQLSQMRLLPCSAPIQMYQEIPAMESHILSILSAMQQAVLTGNDSALQNDASQLYLLLEREREKVSDSSAKSEGHLLEQVIQLVQSSYFDPDLNVSAIAQRLGRNPDVVSRAFRQGMQIGPLEYLHSVRIHAATRLLKENPDLTIRRVAELCGYINIDSFNRAFKRIIGTTAGKYREKLSEMESKKKGNDER